MSNAVHRPCPLQAFSHSPPTRNKSTPSTKTLTNAVIAAMQLQFPLLSLTLSSKRKCAKPFRGHAIYWRILKGISDIKRKFNFRKVGPGGGERRVFQNCMATSQNEMMGNQEVDDDDSLKKLGYDQVLHRGLSAFSNFAFGFTEVAVLASFTSQYGYGLATGGKSNSCTSSGTSECNTSIPSLLRPGNHILGVYDRVCYEHGGVLQHG
jgi:hypothetical protein